jgi:hypothetical protein
VSAPDGCYVFDFVPGMTLLKYYNPPNLSYPDEVSIVNVTDVEFRPVNRHGLVESTGTGKFVSRCPFYETPFLLIGFRAIFYNPNPKITNTPNTLKPSQADTKPRPLPRAKFIICTVPDKIFDTTIFGDFHQKWRFS